MTQVMHCRGGDATNSSIPDGKECCLLIDVAMTTARGHVSKAECDVVPGNEDSHRQ